MGAKEPSKAASYRVAVVLSLLALAIDAATAFGRIFQGEAPTMRLAIAAAVSVALAVLFERRSVVLASLVSAAALIVVIGLMVFPSTTRYGLPMLETFRRMATALGAVGREAAAQVAPALPLPALFLASLVAVWTAAFAAHTLAARARSPFLALLPEAALVSFASLIVRDGARPLYVAGFVVGALGVVFADSLRSISSWGPVVSWQGHRRLPFGSSGTVRTVRRLAVVSLGVAVFAPWILPGFKHPGAVNVRSGNNATGVSLDPMVDIRPQLLSNPAVTVFRVRSDHPAYWRTQSLNAFDGHRWTSGAQATAAPVRFDPTVNTLIRQRIVVDRFSAQPYLPAAYAPIHASGTQNVVDLDPSGNRVVAPDGTYRGFAYDVQSVAASPSWADLEAAGSFERGPGSSPATTLPSDTPGAIFRIARRLTEGQPTTYRKILAIQDYLLSPRFTYSLRVNPGDGTNAVLDFLTKTRKGYCQQFAGTMAVLLRALGIPARIGIGYTPGTYDARTQTYTVSSTNAHSWVEVQFPKYGWLPFESTPGRANPAATSYISLPTLSPNTTPKCRIGPKGIDAFQQCAGGAKNQRGGGRIPNGPAAARGGGGNIRGPQAVRRAARRPRSDAPFIAVIVVAALVALLLSIPVGKAVVRRFSVRWARDPTDRALAAYRRMAAQAADVGIPKLPAETLGEFRTRLRLRVAELDGDLDRLTGLAARAAYAQGGVSSGEADDAVEASESVSRAIRRSRGPVHRAVGLFRIERRRTTAPDRRPSAQTPS